LPNQQRNALTPSQSSWEEGSEDDSSLQRSNSCWNAKDFHDRCDNKGATLNLFQIKDGDCIGGYTTQHWESTEWVKLKGDSSAFLFNMNHFLYFHSNGSGIDISCHISYGPEFTGVERYSELGITFEPFNGSGNCYSWVDKPGYKIPEINGKNKLTNREDGDFTISELEVWAVEKELLLE
jgi:hypothetical protein